jgi:hypothetical protein
VQPEPPLRDGIDVAERTRKRGGDPADDSSPVPRNMSQGLRLIGGMFIAALGALTIARPAGTFVQSASVFATEFGYALTLIAGLTMLPGWRRSLMGRTGAFLSVAGAALLLMPVLKAMETARDLPALFDARFGTEQRQPGAFSESPRLVPFTLTGLVSPGTRPRNLSPKLSAHADSSRHHHSRRSMASRWRFPRARCISGSPH